MSEDICHYDAIIIGAGLSGLTAAIALQTSGLQVLVLEKNGAPGGLCGNFTVENHEFTIACNDFCGKVISILKELNVPVKFVKAKTRIHVNGAILNFPPDIRTYLKLISFIPGMLKIMRFLRKQPDGNISLETLGNLPGDQTVLGEFIKSFAYPNGVTPRQMLFRQFKLEFAKKYNYQHQLNSVPVGGPKAIINAMAARFIDAGGILKLNTRCEEIKNSHGHKTVRTDRKVYTAKYVLTSQPRRHPEPETGRSGMCVSKFVVAVRNAFQFPDGYHTVVYFPANISGALTALDEGNLPGEFCFHLFPSGDTGKMSYSINIYFYLPRGSKLSDQEIDRVRQGIFATVDKLIPGFLDNILFARYISVDDFAAMHDLSSSVSCMTDMPHKPDNYDVENDIYYIGNSVYPPGNHAGAAMLSAMICANKILSG